MNFFALCFLLELFCDFDLTESSFLGFGDYFLGDYLTTTIGSGCFTATGFFFSTKES